MTLGQTNKDNETAYLTEIKRKKGTKQVQSRTRRDDKDHRGYPHGTTL